MTVYAATAAALLLLTLTPVIHADDLSDEDTTEEPAGGPAPAWTFTGEISAYCHYGRTASGAMTQPGVAAMAGVPFGTHLIIDGIGEVIVLDRGGAIYGNRVDVWFSSCDRAVRWGRQRRYVEVWP